MEKLNCCMYEGSGKLVEIINKKMIFLSQAFSRLVE